MRMKSVLFNALAYFIYALVIAFGLRTGSLAASYFDFVWAVG